MTRLPGGAPILNVVQVQSHETHPEARHVEVPLPFVARQAEELAPKTETQRSIRARIITSITDLAQTRLSLYAQAGNSIPLPFLVLLVFWLAMIFASFSLFVSPNPIVIASFFICALSASGALFLIFELDRPFTGLMTISDAPLRHALAPL